MPYAAFAVWINENSASRNSVAPIVVVAICEDVSLTALFGDLNTLFSSVTPPLVVAMFVVFAPSVRLSDGFICHALFVPTSVHDEMFSHVVTLVPYSRRSALSGVTTEPSFETCIRKRTGSV